MPWWLLGLAPASFLGALIIARSIRIEPIWLTSILSFIGFAIMNIVIARDAMANSTSGVAATIVAVLVGFGAFPGALIGARQRKS